MQDFLMKVEEPQASWCKNEQYLQTAVGDPGDLGVKDVTLTFNDLDRVCRRFGTAAVVYPDMAIFIEEWLL